MTILIHNGRILSQRRKFKVVCINYDGTNLETEPGWDILPSYDLYGLTLICKNYHDNDDVSQGAQY